MLHSPPYAAQDEDSDGENEYQVDGFVVGEDDNDDEETKRRKGKRRRKLKKLRRARDDLALVSELTIISTNRSSPRSVLDFTGVSTMFDISHAHALGEYPCPGRATGTSLP